MVEYFAYNEKVNSSNLLLPNDVKKKKFIKKNKKLYYQFWPSASCGSWCVKIGIRA